jgi:transcription initiation factor TFIID subunit 15
MQIKTGSCNGIPMGKIPSQNNMISAIITNPKVGVKVPSDTTFNIEVQTTHLTAGKFTNPTTNYYTAPQDLDAKGDIIGHCHVTVQDIGDMQTLNTPDVINFAFFKGIDDAGNGQGLLKAVVTDGLPVGIYRVCTMISAANHQPVNMPVAQRGAQDDCTKFEVVQSGGGKKASPNKPNSDATKNQDQEGVLKNAGDKGNGDKTQGGATQGGVTQGDAAQGGATQGGATQGGATQGGATQGGATQGNGASGNGAQGNGAQGNGAQTGGASGNGAATNGTQEAGAGAGASDNANDATGDSATAPQANGTATDAGKGQGGRGGRFRTGKGRFRTGARGLGAEW